jgi:hypothetical protein
MDFIAVSKLCCPVCWELLAVLRGDTNKYQVRGRHATVYPVDLPAWLPAGVLEEMIRRFRIYLRDELLILIDQEHNSKKRHAHSLSMESAGFSTSTTTGSSRSKLSSSTSDASRTKGVQWVITEAENQ